MRLAGINNVADANTFFNNFMKTEWKNKHTIVPIKAEMDYRKLTTEANLNEIFCLKYSRRVALDHTLSWRGERFVIKNPPTNLAKQDIEIRCYRDKVACDRQNPL